MYETIKQRYLKNYVTNAQLDKYVSLGVITQEQAHEIRTAAPAVSA